MITLTRITEPDKLEEYYRLRYRIFSDSDYHSLVDHTKGQFDRDEFDDKALHWGWYSGQELIATERFLPVREPADSYCLSVIKDPKERAPLLKHIMDRAERSSGMAESSRIGIRQDHRSLTNFMGLVRAIIRQAHACGFDEGWFICLASHVPFYRRAGFHVLPGTESITSCTAHRTSIVTFESSNFSDLIGV
ncbi:MAG: hypothetical protein GFGODING_02599 [Flavobacteriales bacterium]|nr:hypothetical protein [Flavobacteriales bacterium]NUQ15100.1 GNAT family N-acetyltransferase [Flavobacteriales bacterium]